MSVGWVLLVRGKEAFRTPCFDVMVSTTGVV